VLTESTIRSSNSPLFTLIAAVNSPRILQENLLASPGVVAQKSLEFLPKEGFTSASLAYNSAIEEARADILVFVHQDLYLPARWFEWVNHAIRTLDAAGIRWGVLGAFGSRKGAFGGVGRVFTNGLGLHGNPITSPQPIETLDEIVLILRKSSKLRFDQELPHFHMYGVDICLSARQAGLTNFAIPAFCVHNTHQLLELPPEFYRCYRLIKRKWARYLPIATSCMTVTRFDGELRRKQLAEFYTRIFHRNRKSLQRTDDPQSLLSEEFWSWLHSEPSEALSSPANHYLKT
jgi:hypothetical protein